MRILTSLRSILFASLAATAFGACTTDGGGDGYGDTADDATVAGTFDFWQADNGQWYFHLAAGNGQTLMTSEGYTDRTGAINGALSVMKNGTLVSAYQIEPSTNGDLLLLRAANSEIIATTQVYASKSNATRAITTCINAIDGYIVKHDQVVTGARVALVASPTGQVTFEIHAKNGQTVLTSNVYPNLAEAYNGAFAVQDAGATAANYTLVQTGSTWSFTLVAANHQVIGASQAYTTRESAQAGIAAVIAVLPSIDVF